MNIEQSSTDDLEQYAVFLLNEIDRIVREHRDMLPHFKHELGRVEHELYTRTRKGLNID